MYGMPAPDRSDPPGVLVDVPDGLGVVDVLAHEDLASVLLIAGRPAAIEGDELGGSIVRLATRAGDAVPRPGGLQRLQEWLAEPGMVLDPETGHAEPPDPEMLRPLLRLMAAGQYVVRASAWWCQETDGCGDGVQWCYPDTPMLVTTEPWPPGDEKTISAYRNMIADGQRPAAVVVRPHRYNAYTLYLIDGHHKVAAYRAEQVAPLLIEIIPQRPRPLTRERFRELLRDPEPFARLLDHGGWDTARFGQIP
jgi:hypothetical protein